MAIEEAAGAAPVANDPLAIEQEAAGADLAPDDVAAAPLGVSDDEVGL